MTNAACMAEDDFQVAALRQSSERWFRWLNAELVRRGDTPRSRLLGLWDALEDWFASGDFRGSFVLNAAAELRSEPGHPAHAVIAMHRQALFDLLRDLLDAAGVANPASLAAQVQVLVEGAVTGAVVDREPTVARTGRALTRLVLANGGRG